MQRAARPSRTHEGRSSERSVNISLGEIGGKSTSRCWVDLDPPAHCKKVEMDHDRVHDHLHRAVEDGAHDEHPAH